MAAVVVIILLMLSSSAAAAYGYSKSCGNKLSPNVDITDCSVVTLDKVDDETGDNKHIYNFVRFEYTGNLSIGNGGPAILVIFLKYDQADVPRDNIHFSERASQGKVDIGPDRYVIAYKFEGGIQKGSQVVFMPYPYIPSLKPYKVLALEKGLTYPPIQPGGKPTTYDEINASFF